MPLSSTASALSQVSIWRNAARLARAELRASPRRAMLGVLAIALGASAVTAVHVLSSEMRAKVRGDAREWIAADLLVQFRDPPGDEELRKIRALDHTLVTGTFGMSSSRSVPDAVLTYIRVVDPTRYPFYGHIGLEPPQRLATALGPDTLVASRDLLAALRIQPGATVRLGNAEFRAVAAITHEPDWEVGVSTFLPHVVLSYAGYERSAVAQAGVEADYRLLLRLNEVPLEDARKQLAALFPDCEQLDYRDPSPKAAAALEAAAGFLRLAAWLTLACGAMAVALILYLQVEHRLDSAAIMKALGARYAQLIAVYVAQSAALALAGGILAALLGPLLTKALAAIANGYLPLQLNGQWHPLHILYAMLIAAIATVPAMLIPIIRLRSVKPVAAIRRHMQAARPAAIFGLRRGPVAVRLAARNLFRPGLHTGTMVAALAFGVSLMSATFLCQERVSERVAASVPAAGANLYVIGASRQQVEETGEWLLRQRFVESPLQAFPLVWLRLRSRNGQPVNVQRNAGEWLATCSEQVPSSEVALSPDADVLDVHPGDWLEFTARGQTIRARVAARRVSHLDNVISALTLSCEALRNVPLFYHGAVRATPGKQDYVRRRLTERFPSLPTLSHAEFTRFVGTVADQTVAMMRIVCWQVLAIGTALQLLLIASARRLRLQESAILKALGATPGHLTVSGLVEFACIGALAGMVGVLFGGVLASALLAALFHEVLIAVSAPVCVLAIAGTCALSAAAGAIACQEQARVKPLELLRAE